MGGVATWTPWELLGTGGRRSGNYSSCCCNNNKVASVMVRREGGLAADDSPPRSGIAATSVASTHLSWSGFESQQQASKEAPALSHRREHSPFTRRVGKFISPASHLPPTYDSMLPSWLTSLPTPARTLLHSNPPVVLYAPPPSMQHSSSPGPIRPRTCASTSASPQTSFLACVSAAVFRLQCLLALDTKLVVRFYW